MIILGLNAGAALSAFVAAGFCFISAAENIPKSDKTYAGFLDTPDAIIDTLKYSAKWNRLAALFAGVSFAPTPLDPRSPDADRDDWAKREINERLSQEKAKRAKRRAGR